MMEYDIPIVELYMKEISCQVNSLPNLGIVLSVFIMSLLFYSNPTTYAVKFIDIGYSPHIMK